MEAALILGASVLIITLVGVVFAGPVILGQLLWVRFGSPAGVPIAGASGIAILAVFAVHDAMVCAREPVRVPRAELPDGGYHSSPCDGPGGVAAHAFLYLGVPAAAVAIVVATVVAWRRVRRPRMA